MSTTTVEIETSVVDAVRAAIAARNEGMAQAEDADRSGWNRALIDQAIDAFALTGQPFSSNDLRHLLPDDVPGALMGARFSAAVTGKRIRFVGYTPSTKQNTHGKPVNVYVGRVQAD